MQSGERSFIHGYIECLLYDRILSSLKCTFKLTPWKHNCIVVCVAAPSLPLDRNAECKQTANTDASWRRLYRIFCQLFFDSVWSIRWKYSVWRAKFGERYMPRSRIKPRRDDDGALRAIGEGGRFDAHSSKNWFASEWKWRIYWKCVRSRRKLHEDDGGECGERMNHRCM